MKSDSESKSKINVSSFLGAVAEAYISRYEEMSDLCFVFPNKRSCSFFLKHLTDNLGERVMLAPEVIDISEFVKRLTGLEEDSRIDLLFRLYNVYCSLLGKDESLKTEQNLLDFDRFASWGEVMLNDFSEVEKYCADAAKLFENVRDYRNIASNFLTPEQCDVIERYFGYRPLPEDAERFWKSVYDSENPTQIKEKFVELWRLLPELFEGLKNNLESDKLALEGTIFRKAMEITENRNADDLPWLHVVMVGFNMLSTSEMRIFENLRDTKDEDGDAYGEFFWDATGPVLNIASDVKNRAARDMHRYIKEFPMPEWAKSFIMKSDTLSMPPEITIAAAPSNVAQTKIAGGKVARWLDETGNDTIRNARSAIIVPDEILLLPLLHSLPEGIESVNLTMGYSMRFTAVSSFVYHLKRLQTRRRKTGGNPGYFHEDLRLLLAHPLIHVLTGSDTANKINSEMTRVHLRVVTPEWLGSFSTDLSFILRPIPRESSAAETIAYIDEVLAVIDRALAGNSLDGLRSFNSKIERAQIATYRRALITLLNSVTRHGISMNFMSVFHLVDRLVAGEKINFEGKPLQGLQIMGLLETRAIDFEHLIILSMNDKVMPRKGKKRTFIPDSLRRGYGLPTSYKSEELYSYYFYRVISRAKEVTLIYDARAGEGMRSGGKSRFLMQLEMLYARGMVKMENHTFILESSPQEAQKVEKTDEVMKKLELYTLRENGKNLSASALMNYCGCQVKFYYKNVLGINDDNPAADYIDPITQGNIVHEAMLNLYFPEGKRKRYLKPEEVIRLTSGDFDAMLSDKEMIETIVRRAVNKHYYKLPAEEADRELNGAVAIIAERLVSQIEDVIRHDKKIAPIELLGGEISEVTRWQPGEGPVVNMSYAFDRVDRVAGKIRVIDYKTGSSHVKAKAFEDMFTGDYKSKYMLQLFLYAHLLEDSVKEKEGRDSGPVSMLIYDVNTIDTEGSVTPEISNRKVNDHKEISNDFIIGMENMLNDIFDREKPFVPTDDEKNCRYCMFQALCGKS